MPDTRLPPSPRQIVEGWHRALQRNPDLSRDLRACRAARQAESEHRRPLQELWAAAVWTFLEAAWTSRPAPAAPPLVPLLRDWLSERYAQMWSTAPHVPLLRALDRAIVAGAWDVALDPLLAELDAPAARITVFADWRNPRAPWRPGSVLNPGPSPLGPYDYSDLADYTEDDIQRYFPHKPVLLHVFHDSLDSTVDELRRKWPDLIAPGLPPARGSHGLGDVTEWDKLVTLYRLWRRYEGDRRQSGGRAVKKGFARAARNKTLPLWHSVERLCRNDHRKRPERIAWLAGLSESYVERRLSAAIKLFGPDPAVPALEQYLGSLV